MLTGESPDDEKVPEPEDSGLLICAICEYDARKSYPAAVVAGGTKELSLDMSSSWAMEKKGLGEREMSLMEKGSGGVGGRPVKELDGDERGDEPLEPAVGLEDAPKSSRLRNSSSEFVYEDVKLCWMGLSTSMAEEVVVAAVQVGVF